MQHTRIKQLLTAPASNQTVIVEGWVRTKRDSKAGFSFLEINDGSCLKNIQVIAGQELGNYTSEVLALTTGCSVRATGNLVASPGQGQAVEVKATVLEVAGRADPETFPLQKKKHSFEFLRTIAHLRPRTNTFGAIARLRSATSFAVHSFFQERGFVHVHTPIITASDCEGAGEMFRVSTLNPEKPPRQPDGKIDYTQDFFGKPSFLTVSGQLEGEIYAQALGNIYTFGPTFRAENSNTTRHLAEFWMIEPEMAFCDLRGDRETAEDFLKYVLNFVIKNCAADLEFFNQFIDPQVLETLRNVVENKFAHITYTEAVKLLEKSGEKFNYPVGWGKDLQSEHERFLTEKEFKKPVIITDYPREIKAFYMRQNEDGKTVAAMDILVPRIGEIVGGSQREERLAVLEQRIVEQKLDPKSYWWYLELRKFGSTPHAGFGLGFERLIQFVSGMENIRDVIPFPRTPQSAEF
jgi:asparaginyl-tRNA synthetase